MNELTLLRIDGLIPVREFSLEQPPQEKADARIHYAFLTLLAANIFVVSGVACFAALYFWR